MRILILSDTHRNFQAFCSAVEQQPTAEWVLFLGDELWEYEDAARLYPHKRFLAVCGNNDYAAAEPLVRTLAPGGIRMVMTHGHQHGVYGGLSGLEQLAAETNARVVLFGHTHRGLIEYRSGVYYINPGSASLPRDGCASYAYLDITPAGIVPVRVRMDGEVLQ